MTHPAILRAAQDVCRRFAGDDQPLPPEILWMDANSAAIVVSIHGIDCVLTITRAKWGA